MLIWIVLYFYYWCVVCGGNKRIFTIKVNSGIRGDSVGVICHGHRESADKVFINCNWVSTRWQWPVKLYYTCIINNYRDVLFEQFIILGP
jgi:hypothetical protein